jgi:hypothetical protein
MAGALSKILSSGSSPVIAGSSPCEPSLAEQARQASEYSRRRCRGWNRLAGDGVKANGDVFAGGEGLVAECITCGAELHPERAQKYNYCLAPECQAKNLKGLTMVAVGMNKAAEEFLILDEQTREDMASGKLRDQRRGSFGPAAPVHGGQTVPGGQPAPAGPAAPGGQAARSKPRSRVPVRPAPRPRWTPSQERLALLYNEQGLRPDEIASKLGVSTHLATQIILAARHRRKS